MSKFQINRLCSDYSPNQYSQIFGNKKGHIAGPMLLNCMSSRIILLLNISCRPIHGLVLV